MLENGEKITEKVMYIVRQKKRTTVLSWISLSIGIEIWQNLLVLLLVNIIVDVTDLISGIYTNFRTLLCKMCDVGYYVIKHMVYWCLQKIVL